MKSKIETKKGNRKNKAKSSKLETSDTHPAGFLFFPFTTLFLPAIMANPAGAVRAKRRRGRS